VYVDAISRRKQAQRAKAHTGRFTAQQTQCTQSAARIFSLTRCRGRQKQEIFADLLERLTVSIAPSGSVQRAQIDGEIVIKNYLQGDVDVSLALCEGILIGDQGIHPHQSAIVIDDYSFHPCVTQNLNVISNIRFPISNFQFPIFDFQFPISNFQYSIYNLFFEFC
jgi:hypothetical protein